MNNQILICTFIVLLILALIYLYLRDRSNCYEYHKKSEILVIDRVKPYPKAQSLATFDRDNDFKFEVKASKKSSDRPLPKAFSCTKQWKDMIIGVYDQDRCGSCWAFSATSCLTDRIRIKSGGKLLANDYLSPFHLAACMKCNHNDICPEVCEGNYLDDVLEYLVTNGAICQSDIDKNTTNKEEYMCVDTQSYGIKHWKGIKKYRVNLYPPGLLDTNPRYLLENENAIMDEIMTNGPVCCIIKVYIPNDSRNFYNYRSGIYGLGWKEEPLESEGYHAITIVGWGEDNVNGKQEKYWIVRNSWGSDWGTSGFGKVLRGVNFGYIESDNWGILPDLS